MDKDEKWRCLVPCLEYKACVDDLQSVRSELAQNIEYQDSLHEKIATLEAEVDCRILLSEHNRIVMELKSQLEQVATEARREAEHDALMTLAGLLLSNGGKLGIRHDVAQDLDNKVVVHKWTDEACCCEWFEATRSLGGSNDRKNTD